MKLRTVLKSAACATLLAGAATAETTNLRIQIRRFTKELLRDQRRTVGRLDSRFKGIDEDVAAGSLALTRPERVDVEGYAARKSAAQREKEDR